MGRNTLLACRLASERLEITWSRSSASGAMWRRALEREGRAIASAVQYTRPSMRKMVTAGCPGGPGRRPVARKNISVKIYQLKMFFRNVEWHRWYKMLKQVGLGEKGVKGTEAFILSGTGWKWDYGIFMLGGTRWNKKQVSVELNQSTGSKVELQGRLFLLKHYSVGERVCVLFGRWLFIMIHWFLSPHLTPLQYLRVFTTRKIVSPTVFQVKSPLNCIWSQVPFKLEVSAQKDRKQLWPYARTHWYVLLTVEFVYIVT